MISLNARADAKHAEVLPFVSDLESQHGWRMLLLDRASYRGLHIRACSLQGRRSFMHSGPASFRLLVSGNGGCSSDLLAVPAYFGWALRAARLHCQWPAVKI